MIRYLLSSIGLFCLAFSVNAATMLIDSSGRLTGATGIDIGGTLYDVSFEDGTCVEFFDGCDQAEDFIFDANLAQAASAALLEQVFIDVTQGSFDTQPGQVDGCKNNTLCLVYTPYGVNSITVLLDQAQNHQVDTADVRFQGSSISSFDTSERSNDTLAWAVWSQSSLAVPIPAAGYLFSCALITLLGARRLAH